MGILSGELRDRGVLLTVVLLLSTPALAVEIQSLEQFKAELIKSSPRLVVQRETLNISTRDRKSAFGALFPELNLTSSLVADHETDPEPLDQTSSALKLSANIYNSHLDWYAYRIAQENERVAELEYYTEVGALVLNGVNLYLDFSDASVNLRVAEQRKKLVDDQFRNSSRSYRSGTSTRLDYLRLQSEKKSAEFEERRAQSDFDQARNRLMALFDADAEKPTFKALAFDARERLPSIPTQISSENHPELQIERHRTQAAEYGVTQARRRWWPQVTLDSEWSRGISGHWVDGVDPAWGTEWKTTLNFTFNLFDGGRLSNELANQRSRVVINQSQAELKKLELDSTLSNLVLESARLRDQVQNATEILEIETQVFRSISQEYQVGNLSYLDFINSLNRRLSAQLSLQTSISGYLKSYYSALYHQGVLLDGAKK